MICWTQDNTIKFMDKKNSKFTAVYIDEAADMPDISMLNITPSPSLQKRQTEYLLSRLKLKDMTSLKELSFDEFSKKNASQLIKAYETLEESAENIESIGSAL